MAEITQEIFPDNYFVLCCEAPKSFFSLKEQNSNLFYAKKSLQKTEVPLLKIRNQDSKRLYFSRDQV